jgi:hypothetical protein
VNRAQIVGQLRRMAAFEDSSLEKLKSESAQFGEHPDWPWIGLVLSGATRGGSWRWEKSVKPRYEDELSWSAISELAAEERRVRLETVGRFWRQTAIWLEHAYLNVHAAGGPLAVRERLSQMSANDVINYWKSFKGVKDKYARNIMMDIYHPNFRKDFFAIDSRLEALLPILGYAGQRNYLSMERFLLDLSREVGLNAWDLDRLLYSKHSEIKQQFETQQI